MTATKVVSRRKAKSPHEGKTVFSLAWKIPTAHFPWASCLRRAPSCNALKVSWENFPRYFPKIVFFSICLLCLMRLTNLVWTQSIGFPTYCRVVTAIENVTSKMTVAFVCKRKIAESIFTWFIYNSSSNSSSAIVSKLCRYELEIFYASEEGRENVCIRFPSNYW